MDKISIHALLAESDDCENHCTAIFQYFYPRSPCGERPCKRSCVEIILNISIHALLAESDTGINAAFFIIYAFLSTLSLRRATHGGLPAALHHVYFYPRSPCGERRNQRVGRADQNHISIHALLAESDRGSDLRVALYSISIHALLAESDERQSLLDPIPAISIHALLAESDTGNMTLQLKDGDISIHALLAESDYTNVIIIAYDVLFLSTLSLRRATLHLAGQKTGR